MIELTNLTFNYGAEAPILKNFNWRVERGASWAVIGPSGCGKTTLLYLLAGLRTPTGGEIRIHEEVVTRPRPETGLILQAHGLLPWATVWENTRLGARIRDYYGPDGEHAPEGADVTIPDAVTEGWLDRLGLPALRDKYPSQLSGGQRQRTAIARTLTLDPDLLLMDEPFSALDAPTREDLQNLTMALQSEASFTSIIVTHSIEEAALLGQKILILGNPPNTEALVVENVGAGSPDFRGTPAYEVICDELRARIGEEAA